MAATLQGGRVPKNLLQRANDAKSPRSLVSRSQAARKEHGEEAMSMTASLLGKSMSSTFLAQGMEKGPDYITARSTGRYVFPSKDQKPDVGRYRPEYGVVMSKAMSASFAERSPHESRKMPRGGDQDGAGWHQDMSSSTLTSFATFPTDVAGHRGLMALESPRRELREQAGVKMHESPVYAKEWHTRDEITSGYRRSPKWDFDKLPPRSGKLDSGMVYYQPAMYAVQHDSVLPSPKSVVAFSKQLSNEAPGQLGHQVSPLPAAGSPKTRAGQHESVTPDRSLFRGGAVVSPRVLCVKDLSKAPAREPLFSTGSSWHDEGDPKASEEVLERERKFDALAAMKPVARRTDFAPTMSRSLTRSKARSGVRPLPGVFELTRECTDRDAKENPSRTRKGMGTTAFGLQPGRSPSLGGQASPLRRPRRDVAPVFSRTAPAGFTTRASIGSLKAAP
jgi:hypothetical protein